MALCTLDDVKGYLGADLGDPLDDDLLSRLVESESRSFKRQTDRDIEAATYTEVLSGDGRSRVMLKNYPVISVTSVSVDGVTVPALANGSGWRVADASAGILEVAGSAFTRGAGNVQVVYRAGYEANAIPDDIREAVVELVASRFKERPNLIHQSASVGGELIQFRQFAAPPNAYAVIQAYRRPGGAA